MTTLSINLLSVDARPASSALATITEANEQLDGAQSRRFAEQLESANSSRSSAENTARRPDANPEEKARADRGRDSGPQQRVDSTPPQAQHGNRRLSNAAAEQGAKPKGTVNTAESSQLAKHSQVRSGPTTENESTNQSTKAVQTGMTGASETAKSASDTADGGTALPAPRGGTEQSKDIANTASEQASGTKTDNKSGTGKKDGRANSARTPLSASATKSMQEGLAPDSKSIDSQKNEKPSGESASSYAKLLIGSDTGVLPSVTDQLRSPLAIGSGTSPSSFQTLAHAAATIQNQSPLNSINQLQTHGQIMPPLYESPPGQAVNLAIAAPLYSDQFAGSLASELSFAVRGGVEKATISITPEELGPIQVELRLDGTEASIQFMALNADTRSAVADSQEILRSLLADKGLSLERFDVSQQNSAFAQQFSKDDFRRQANTGGAPYSDGAKDLSASTASTASSTIRRVGLLNLVA